ncbi:hypothetical protein TRAPUB_14398, partial [Trametes pubescens]
MAAVRRSWDAHAEAPRPSSRAKRWWNQTCTDELEALRTRRSRTTRRTFKRSVKKAKEQFYEERIAAAREKGKRVWDVVSWTNPRALPMYKALVHDGRLLVELDDLWSAVDAT